MTRNEAIKVIRKEYACVDADCDIERNCGRCELHMPSKEPILKAYEMAIQALSQDPCDDAISRDMVKEALRNRTGESISECINAIPPINPQPCEDAVSRKDVINAIDKWITEYKPQHHLIQSIRELPSVTQKSGKWIVHPEIETSTPEYLMFYECSECGDKQCFCKSDIHKKRFCSNCGAKMVEPQESEEV